MSATTITARAEAAGVECRTLRDALAAERLRNAELRDAAKLGAHAIRELLFQVPAGFSAELRAEFNKQAEVIESACNRA